MANPVHFVLVFEQKISCRKSIAEIPTRQVLFAVPDRGRVLWDMHHRLYDRYEISVHHDLPRHHLYHALRITFVVGRDDDLDAFVDDALELLRDLAYNERLETVGNGKFDTLVG